MTKKIKPSKRPPDSIGGKTIDLSAYKVASGEMRPKPVAVKDLYLDPKNPRLADVLATKSQASILQAMEKNFELQPLIDSMLRNGFFWEEPMVAVREPLLERKNEIVLIVIEGNRRLAALKMIHSNAFGDAEARARLKKVPVIVRGQRAETLAFVGFRHITGIIPWEAAAKAQYALDLVRANYTIDEIAERIGDEGKDIERWVRTQSLIELAKAQGLREDDAAKSFFFSYLLTATDAPGTKRWLEMKSDDKRGIVEEVNQARLKKLWQWLYGSRSEEVSPAIPESRQIHKLNRIIAHPGAVKELEATGNFNRAFSQTKERGEYIVDRLTQIRDLLQDLSGYLSGLDGQELFGKRVEDLPFTTDAKREFIRIQKSIEEIKSKLTV
jgi:predicted transcriptional regulator